MRQGLKWLITWARMPRLSKQYLPSLCDMCINEQGKTSKSVWDKGPVHFHLPLRKKEKKKIRLYGNWSLYMKPLHELSQKRTSLPRSQIVCSAVFLTSKHSISSQRVFMKEKKKMLLACPLSSSQPLKPKINHMVAQWMILGSLVRCLCWKKIFGVFVKCPSPH